MKKKTKKVVAAAAPSLAGLKARELQVPVNRGRRPAGKL